MTGPQGTGKPSTSLTRGGVCVSDALVGECGILRFEPFHGAVGREHGAAIGSAPELFSRSRCSEAKTVGKV